MIKIVSRNTGFRTRPWLDLRYMYIDMALYAGKEAARALLAIRRAPELDINTRVFGIITRHIGNRVRAAAMATGLSKGLTGHGGPVDKVRAKVKSVVDLPTLMTVILLLTWLLTIGCGTATSQSTTSEPDIEGTPAAQVQSQDSTGIEARAKHIQSGDSISREAVAVPSDATGRAQPSPIATANPTPQGIQPPGLESRETPGEITPIIEPNSREVSGTDNAQSGTVPEQPSSLDSNIVEGDEGEFLPSEIMDLLRQGDALIQGGSHRDGITKYIEASTTYGRTSYVIDNRIGVAYVVMDRPQEGISYLTESLKLKRSWGSLTSRAIAYLDIQEYKLAIEDLEEALGIQDYPEGNPGKGLNPRLNAAWAYIKLGNYQQARTHREAGLQIATEFNIRNDATGNLQHLLAEIERLEQGRKYPEDVLLGRHQELEFEARSYLAKGNYEQALERLLSIRQGLKEPSSRLEVNIGGIYSTLGAWDKAVEHANNAVALRDDAYTRFRRGSVLANTGDCSNAKTDAESAIAKPAFVEPGRHSTAEAYFIIGICHASQENFAKAKEQIGLGVEVAEQSGYSGEELEVYTDFLAEPLSP